jgi:hypothetical protein
MKTTFFSVACIIAIPLMLSSCAKNLPAQWPGPYPVISLVPGECIQGTELVLTNHIIESIEGRQERVFGFKLVDVVSKYEAPSEYFKRFVPTDELFAQYGERAKAVKEKYEDIYRKNIAHNFNIYTVSVDTLNIVLTADKDYAGIPAGDNLAKIMKLKLYSNDRLASYIPFPADVLFTNMPDFQGEAPVTLKNGEKIEGWHGACAFRLITDGYSVTKETVHFNLQIPVRIYNYLQWLNDSLSDENAPITWRDEVFISSFTVERGCI